MKKLSQTERLLPKIVRYAVFISSHDQNIGPINLIGLFSTQTLPNRFHVIASASNP